MPTNPLTIDEGLGCGCNAVFSLERIGLFARGKVLIIHFIAARFEQVLGFKAIGAGVIGHDHAVEHCGFYGLGHW
jgi:hypothetical protein